MIEVGQGGFGPVYKVTFNFKWLKITRFSHRVHWLIDGQEVAVKRLSRRSVQGIEELKNGHINIKTHRNHVRLWLFIEI